MTLYNRPRYPTWYRNLRHTVFARAHGICEVNGCGKRATELHHLCYPTARREEPRDLMAVCTWHHHWFHFTLVPANDNEEAEQLELAFPANDNAPRKRDVG
jgi:hypothetical protein